MSEDIPSENNSVVSPSSIGAVPANQRNAYSWEKKMEVVSRYMLLGNMRVVSEQTGVNPTTLAEWKKSDWWPEMVETIRRQSKGKQNASITKIIEQSLEVVEDRLTNGDWIFNNKSGQIVRKPVGVKEASTIANNLLQRQVQLEELMEKTEHGGDTVADTLKLIAKELQKNFVKKETKTEVIDDVPFVEVVEKPPVARVMETLVEKPVVKPKPQPIPVVLEPSRDKPPKALRIKQAKPKAVPRKPGLV